jgi:hypothetical protein
MMMTSPLASALCFFFMTNLLQKSLLNVNYSAKAALHFPLFPFSALVAFEVPSRISKSALIEKHKFPL